MGKDADSKTTILREGGSLNPRAHKVTDPLFLDDPFFDAKDLVQVKYEMLRRVTKDGQSVTQASSLFGFSRPSFYEAKTVFENEGIPGLIPKKRGPHGGHKMTGEVLSFMKQKHYENDDITVQEMTQLIKGHFNLIVHPKTVQRTLARIKKKRV